MDGASAALAVVGVTFQFFHIGRIGFKLVSQCQNTVEDAQVVLTRIRIERQRYEAWAEEAGLTAENPALFEERRRDSQTTIALTVDILAHICDLLTEEKGLVKLYGLQPTGSASVTGLNFPLPPNLTKPLALELTSQDARKRREESLLTFQKRLSAMGKLKWALREKQKFEVLVNKLKTLNDGLRDVLPPVQRNILDRTLLIGQPEIAETLAILSDQELVDRSRVSRDYAAAARFRRLTMQNPSFNGGRLPPMKSIDPDEVDFGSDHTVKRSLTKYQGNMVLVEYKSLAQQDKAQQAIILDRIKNLASLLSVKPKPYNYRGLDCIGWCEAPKNSSTAARWALVFELPHRVKAIEEPKICTLAELLPALGDKGQPQEFSLGMRFRLAAMLASSIAELHATGWLHHGITSQNVLFFNDGNQDWDLYRPYLCGFGLARADSSRELSEVIARAGDALYQDPRYLSNTKDKFKRSFDLYALGVVLVEVGLWKRIAAFQKPNQDAQGFAATVRSSAVPQLAFITGNTFRDAVQCCLTPDLFEVGDDEGSKLTGAFSKKVAAALESCNA